MEEIEDRESKIAKRIAEEHWIQMYPVTSPPYGGRCDEWYS